MDRHWEVYALKYAEKTERLRMENFMFDDHPGDKAPIDFFVWVLKQGERIILVDTGYDRREAERRGMPILRDPVEALAGFGIDAAKIDTVIVSPQGDSAERFLAGAQTFSREEFNR